MNLLNRLTIKNLKLNKHRTLVTIVGILLSVSLLTAVSSLFFSARSSLLLYQKQEQGNYHYSFQNLSLTDYETLKYHHSVEQIDIVNNLGYARLEESQNEYKPYAYLRTLPEHTEDLLPIKLTEGRLPKNETELLIPTHLRHNGKVNWEVGDTVTLSVGQRTSGGFTLNQGNPYSPDDPEELIRTQTRTYKIVGIMERFPYRLEDYESPGYTFFTCASDDVVTSDYDVFVRYTKDALKKHTKVTAQILGVGENQIFESDWRWVANDYLILLESGILGDPTLQALAMAVMVVILIVIATSVFCIQNSFEISITEKIQQYGMLSSIGATRRQIRKNVYFEALILGSIGIPLGCLAGILASYVLILVSNHFLADTLTFTLIFSFSIYAILFAVALGLITILLSARKSASKASRISPIQAIRNQTEIRLHAKHLHAPKWVSRFFGIGGEIAYKNLKRSRRKYRTTVVSIVICVCVFIALSSFVTLAFDTVKAEYGDYDYTLSIGYSLSQDIEEKKEEIYQLENIDSISTMIHTNFSMSPSAEDFTATYKEYLGYSEEMFAEDYEYLSIYFLDDAAFRSYTDTLHLDYESVKEKAILVNTVFVEFYNKEKKSSVTAETEVYNWKSQDTIHGFFSPDDEEQPQLFSDIQIGAVTDQTPFGISNRPYYPMLIVTSSYQGILPKLNQVHEWMYIDSKETQHIQSEIEQILGDDLFSSDNVEENTKSIRSFYTLLSIFLYGFIIVIALIGVTNIFNTITTNMNLRRREFASLTSIGMTKKEFHHMIWLESFFYGMKSLLIGIPLGIILSYGIYRLLSNGTIMLAFRLPIAAICTCVFFVFALLLIIMRYSIGKIQKQNMIETIRNENI